MAKVRLSGNPPTSTTGAIARVEITQDTLTGRGGLALFSRYVRHVGILGQLEGLFGPLRRSGKGQPVSVLFHQLFCFLVDATSRHLVYFDDLKRDEGYARVIETAPEQMASSHAIKRWFGSFGWGRIWTFRRVLRWLFMWRLRLEQPPVVLLGLDTMVMDNDEALMRQGCQPTYKKVKGFQPLQLTWGPFVVDALFRGGKKNGNAGDMAGRLVRDMVAFVRNRYRRDVPIVVRMDAGFFDKKLFRLFESLGIGYITSGRLEADIIERAQGVEAAEWSAYDNGRQLWQYFEFQDRRTTWRKAEWRRALYTRPAYEDQQRLLEFARPDHVLYTNLGCGEAIDTLLEHAGCAHWTEAERIIELQHDRGSDELIHRALKEFRSEQLPFKRFQSNAAFYYTTLLAFFLFETFKQDVTAPALVAVARPTRLRREVIDFAAKIVRHSGETVLKVTSSVWHRLRLPELWNRAAQPPPLLWA